MQKHGKKIHVYVFKLRAAISDDFGNSPEMAAHDLDTYIFTFTKIGMLSPNFSEKRPAFLKLFFQWGSFDISLIRVGASPEFTTVTSTMSRLNYRTHIKHCELALWDRPNIEFQCQSVYISKIPKFSKNSAKVHQNQMHNILT